MMGCDIVRNYCMEDATNATNTITPVLKMNPPRLGEVWGPL
jgi:hypothetical protein